tara:strand:+ start:5435 stop:5863 length:429 start_codon:yes stop_codon:yes gene_type:complete
MTPLLLASVLFLTDPMILEHEATYSVCQESKQLSDLEREQIVAKMHLAIIRMYSRLDKAEEISSYITDVNAKKLIKDALTGAIFGIGGKTPYSVVIGGFLGTIAHLSGHVYDAVWLTIDTIKDANSYAQIADDLQERLWMDE